MNSSPLRRYGSSSTMPIFIDDDDHPSDEEDVFAQTQLLLWYEARAAAAAAAATTTTATAATAAAAPPTAPTATSTAASTTTASASAATTTAATVTAATTRTNHHHDDSSTISSPDRKLSPKELEALNHRLAHDGSDETIPMQTEQERQDALLAMQLAKPLTEQERQDELLAKKLAAELNKQHQQQPDHSNVASMEDTSSTERKRRLEEEDDSSTLSSSDRKLNPKELEALNHRSDDVIQTQTEQERQDALLAMQLANPLTEQERQDELLAKKLAAQLNKQPDNSKDELVAKRLASMEDTSYAERKRRLEEEETKGLAYALQMQDQLQAEAAKEPKARPTKEESLQILDARTELKAFQYVEAKAREQHEAALPKLKERVRALGFSDEALENCLYYIREDAPVTIHLTQQTLAHLVKDTHYRNLFETSTSGGCKDALKRATWEHNLFGGAYDGCPPFQRPKYGCLNISGDLEGVVPARSYGRLFITLASHMRYRCTFFDADTGNAVSSSKDSTLATHNYYAHILMQYPDLDLTATLSVSRISGSPSLCTKYKEVQIHGPICLATDIQSLSVPGRAKDTNNNELRGLVLAFQEQTGCNILWQEDLLLPDDDDADAAAAEF